MQVSLLSSRSCIYNLESLKIYSFYQLLQGLAASF
ncbi:hypothetical protein SLEP1_g13592 [Rubroshorea leprosula]|uniref:Uncharacterized protein n=1 Tax=Rubroshorea leprosula TaxID=152421 RepID=A0AAV5IMA8_9ROSI|nr:hypothetical protein SLEP1_g13592 [Rubroshorea leprosula]